MTSAASGFRSAYAGTLWMRVADACLHAAAAIVVPGHWWLQYVPDAAVVPLWLWSMRTDRFMPESSWLLALHRLLHLRGVGSWRLDPLLLFYLPLLFVWPWLAVHVLVHVAIDRFTHDGGWQ